MQRFLLYCYLLFLGLLLLLGVRLCATPWTVTRQASLSMGILQARVLEGLPCPSLGDIPNPGIEPKSSALQVDSLPSEPPGKHLLGASTHFSGQLLGLAAPAGLSLRKGPELFFCLFVWIPRVFDLGVARPLKEGADPAEAVGQLCVRPAQTPKPQARFSP